MRSDYGQDINGYDQGSNNNNTTNGSGCPCGCLMFFVAAVIYFMWTAMHMAR